MQPWKDKEMRSYLQKLWPLLGVRKLDKQMDEALLYARKPPAVKEEVKPVLNEKAKMQSAVRAKRTLKKKREKATQ